MTLRLRQMLGVLLVLAGCGSQGDKSAEEFENRLADPNGEARGVSSSGSGGSGAGLNSGPAGNGAAGHSAAAGGKGGTAQAPVSAGKPGSNAFGAAADSAGSPLPENAGEKYTDVGVNPFVIVEHDPFSTFAADVDTASYDIFRRDVNLGLAPQPTSVRLEDYVNNFAYAYPAPDAQSEHPFAISLAAAPHPSRDGITLLRVGIQARLPADTAKRATNLVFLVDVSGSMQSAEKLPIVKHVLTQALTMLDPTDKVSIVTYASGTNVALVPTLVQSADVITAAIDNLQAGGSTNGAGGIQLAYEQAAAGFIEDGINHIVLCTDGDFNVGAASDEALVDLIEEKRETGVTLTALGFGIGNLNDSMMEKVSNAGNGIYTVVSSVVQADIYVEDRLLASLEHVAKDVKLQLELNPEHVLAYRLLGYENRAIADTDFREDEIDAGEIGAGHRVTALYELVMAGGAVPSAKGAPKLVEGDAVEGEREIEAEDLVLVKVRYKQPGASAEDAAVEVTQALQPGDLRADIAEVDADLEWAVAMAMFAEVLKQSPYAAESDLDAIEAMVEQQSARDGYRTELAALFARYRAIE